MSKRRNGVIQKLISAVDSSLSFVTLSPPPSPCYIGSLGYDNTDDMAAPKSSQRARKNDPVMTEEEREREKEEK